MRLTGSSLAVVSICIALPLAGCGGPTSPAASDSSPSPTAALPSAPPSPKSTGAAGENDWWEAPLLTEPQYTNKVVIAEQKERGDKTLPALLSNGKDPIRVVVACSGNGDVTILVNNIDNGSHIECDKIRTFIDIHTEASEQQITLTSGSDVRWKAAVIQE